MGQRFDYTYQGVWYPAGPVLSLDTNLCLTAPLPTSTDQESVTLERCDGSCRQLWMVNAPFFNGSTPVRRLAHTKKEVQPATGAAARLLCWVMTNPSNHPTKAKAVRETWGRHCDTFLFVSTEQVQKTEREEHEEE